MSAALDKLAASVGIEPEYLTLTGETERVSDDAKRATLRAMGIAAEDDDAIAASLVSLTPVELGALQAPAGVSCFLPAWLKDDRCWGIACQLYGLRSERNAGIGDFEDLARLAEIAAKAGADFIGVNPLHALVIADPERCSPFYPSNREFLNALYIAIDCVPGAGRLSEALTAPSQLRASDLVDYRNVAHFKIKALGYLFRAFRATADDAESDAFERFVAERGRPLYLHALFEALSEAMAQQGHGATWHGWPEEFCTPETDSVRAFAEEQAELVTFHAWLQWLADRQLGEAQARAGRAGMRIGLYLDLAVGVAPDGSATWSDRELVVPGARIGAPPDYFNAAGQDWGIAPLSPAGLAARGFLPFREAIDAVLHHAGALRIDHAMSLYRLFWIAERFTAAEGVYVRYPLEKMLRALAEVSQERRAIVIGEDLGVVPPGFREVMREAEIQSYRVFFFEKRKDFFLPPEAYPREALACITTHDLPTLAGWWSGEDISVRAAIGMTTAGDVPLHLEERAHERRRMLGLLSDNGLLPAGMEPVMRGEAEPPPDLPQPVAVGLHRLVARTPSRLFAVPAEDLTGATGQVNIPGTMGEHPNWRRKLPVDIEDLRKQPLFRAVTAALNEERPRRRTG
jgi:4-alpha-glucanotransferase